MPRRIEVRIVAAAVLCVLVAIFVPPWINISHFRRGILQSVSAGLGRPVRARAVELTLFPRPAFILHDLIVEEDPAYGAEPVLMASSVTASLRASTLWHRRVEIATLHLDAPSLNLTRNRHGQWNFEPLLNHSGGPRGASAPGPSMPFPYVEAAGARINFKLGPEKLPFSLEEADLAVWRESGNEWHIRLQARPVRTDIVVSNAGQIRAESTLRVGAALENAPIQGSVEWRKVQLGEISRLLHGNDTGWRGTVDWTGSIQGTLEDTALSTDLQVQEFRRAEFVPLNEMDLSIHCQARYHRGANMLDALLCNAPVGSGQMIVRGSWPIAPRLLDADAALRSSLVNPITAPLRIALGHAPAQFFLDLFGHLHPGVPPDARIAGELQGRLTCESAGLQTLKTCRGTVHSTRLTVRLPDLSRPIQLPELALEDNSARPDASRLAERPMRGKKASAASLQLPARRYPVEFALQPAQVVLGSATAATLTGSLNATGSAWSISGPADLAELIQLARSLRMPLISGQIRSARGTAQLALQVRTTWLPQPVSNSLETDPTLLSVPAHWLGSLQIHNATLALAVLPGRIQLASGTASLTPAGVEWTGLSGNYAHTPFTGSLQLQTPCPPYGAACARTFAFQIPNLNVGRLESALHQQSASPGLLERIGSLATQPWVSQRPALPEISGTVQVKTFSLGRLSMQDANLRLTLAGRQAHLDAMTGTVFDGALRASGSAIWDSGTPIYTLHAALGDLRPNSVAELWKEHWGRGLAQATIEMTTHGWSTADLAQYATGEFSADWLDGGLSAASLASTPLGHFQHWQATGTIGNQTISIRSGRLDSARLQAESFQSESDQSAAGPSGPDRPALPQLVTGSITFARVLDLHLRPSGLTVRGPFSDPVVTGATTGTSPVAAEAASTHNRF